ncbi:hypothetical protein ACP70R_013166 [Stipagrostis hirtigluma subsp. patula]
MQTTLCAASTRPASSSRHSSKLGGRRASKLPEPDLSFAARDGEGNMEFFALFGRGENKSLIAAVDQNGFAIMYDLDGRVVHYMANPHKPRKFSTVSLAVGDGLYVMDRCLHSDSRGGFEALTFDKSDWTGLPYWRWHCLELPPYVHEPRYKPTTIGACTVVGGSSIWISVPGVGTYGFDTVRASWSPAPVASWELPFNGRADYFPEYDQWLGFSSETNKLCSWDMSAATGSSEPVLCNVFEDVEVPHDWTLESSHLVRLGPGMFCVAKFFERVFNTENSEGFIFRPAESFVVLTGLMLKPRDNGGKRLEATMHKCRVYKFECVTTGCIY